MENTEIHRGEGHAKTEVGIGIKEYQKLSEARRQSGNGLSLSLQKEETLLTPWFQTFGFQNCERITYVILSHQFAVIRYDIPKKTNTRRKYFPTSSMRTVLL